MRVFTVTEDMLSLMTEIILTDYPQGIHMTRAKLLDLIDEIKEPTDER